MTHPWTRVAALLGLLGVGLGAFGAHSLKDIASPEQLEWWRTASLYQLLHAAPLLALDRLGGRGPVRLAGLALTGGVLIFSGSLYAMGLGAPRWLGAITPVGGLALMVGWAALLYACTAGAAEARQNSE